MEISCINQFLIPPKTVEMSGDKVSLARYYRGEERLFSRGKLSRWTRGGAVKLRHMREWSIIHAWTSYFLAYALTRILEAKMFFLNFVLSHTLFSLFYQFSAPHPLNDTSGDEKKTFHFSNSTDNVWILCDTNEIINLTGFLFPSLSWLSLNLVLHNIFFCSLLYPDPAANYH